MVTKKFQCTRSHVNVGTIGHIDPGKTTLKAAVMKVQSKRNLAKVISYADIAMGGTMRDAILESMRLRWLPLLVVAALVFGCTSASPHPAGTEGPGSSSSSGSSGSSALHGTACKPVDPPDLSNNAIAGGCVVQRNFTCAEGEFHVVCGCPMAGCVCGTGHSITNVQKTLPAPGYVCGPPDDAGTHASCIDRDLENIAILCGLAF